MGVGFIFIVKIGFYLYFTNLIPIQLQINEAEILSQNLLSSFNKIFTKIFVFTEFYLKIQGYPHRRHILKGLASEALQKQFRFGQQYIEFRCYQ